MNVKAIFQQKIRNFINTHIQMKQQEKDLKRSNNIPMAVLGYLTPKEKREKLEIFGMINYAI